MQNVVKFPNGVGYYSDSALAVCAMGIVARANMEVLREWAEKEYGEPDGEFGYAERATHYRFNRPEAEEYHAGAYPTKPLVFTSDSRMGDDAACWVRADVWDRWGLGESLLHYACLSEEKYSIYEALAKQEAYSNWISGEVESAMESAGFSEEDMEKFTTLAMYELFLDAARDADQEWIEQSGGDMWIDVSTVLPYFLTAARNQLAKEATV